MTEFDDTAETVREIAKRDREIETLRARVAELEKLTVDQANIILISMENAEHRIALQNQLAAIQTENARLREALKCVVPVEHQHCGIGEIEMWRVNEALAGESK